MDLVVTDVPLPPVPLYLADAPLPELFPMVPPMSKLTPVVAMLSHAGRLNLTALADRDGGPDVEVLPGVRRALQDLARSVPVREAGGRGDR